jgi:hypothetical protein
MHGFPEEALAKLQDIIRSLKLLIENTQGVYRSLFLTKELERMQRVYKPASIKLNKTVFTEDIINRHTKSVVLDFYPTKDYADLLRFKISRDCTGFGLGKAQVNTHQFFNIRVFKGSKWVGNIYMLDLTKEAGVLLVDRIQKPRDRSANYLHFFDNLKEVFRQMFEEVHYRQILCPVTISNHRAIQSLWHAYRERLPRGTLCCDGVDSSRFESLSVKGYRVFLEKQ